MAFFDDIQKSISTAGKQAADTAKVMANITKKRTELHVEEQKIEECYARIGKRLYESMKDTPAEEDLVDFNEIETRIAAIASLEEEIQQLKGKKECPNCGEMVEKGSKYCNHCGQEM